MTNIFFGVDASFSGFGLSEINTEEKTVKFREFSVDVLHRSFCRNYRCCSRNGRNFRF